MSAPADADASLAQSDIPLDASAGSAGGASAAAASSSSFAAAAALPPPPPPLLAEDAAARALYVPITYGNISTCLGKKQGSGETMFKWTCYVRSPDGVDLSAFISRVVFTLHPTFMVPVREVSSPPFETSELGWGMFDIGIQIVLHDPAAAPLSIVHKLKLYQTDKMGHAVGPVSPDRPFVDDHYDEMVFNSLPEDAEVPFATQHLLPEHDATADLARVKAARIKMAHDLRQMEERLALRRGESARLKEDSKTLGLL